MPKIALDTNVVVSGLFFEGNERDLLVAGLLGRYELILSRSVYEETLKIVERKFAGSEDLESALIFLEDIWLSSRHYSDGIEGDFLSEATGIIRDPKDAPHAAFILAVQPDVFATGDADFLDLAAIGSTRMMNARQTLDLIKKR